MDNHFQNIISNIDKGNYIDAKNEILSIISEPSLSSPELVKYLGLVNIKLNLYEEAQLCFEKVVETLPKDALSWYYLGIIFDSQNKLNKAKECFYRVIELREDYIDAYVSLMIVLFKLKDLNSILILEKKVLSLVSDNFEILDILAITHFELGDFSKTKEYLIKALEINPQSIKALNQLANLYIAQGDNNSAVGIYQKAVQFDDSGMTLYNFGMLYLSMNEFENAYKTLKKAYKRDNNHVYLASFALSCLTLAKWEEAIEHFSNLVSKFPDDTYMYNLGCAYQGAGKLEEAAKTVETLRLKYPTSPMILKRLSQIYTAQENYLKATEIYSKLILTSKFDINMYYECALLCIKCQDFDNAEELLKKILLIEPDNALMHKDMAIIYLSRKMFDYALSEFETAYKLAPENISVLFEFGNYYQIMSDFKSARKYYNKILKINDNLSVDMLLTISINFMSLNMKNKALKLLLKAYDKEKQNPSVLFNLGKVYFMLGKTKTALPLLEDAYNLKPDIEISNLLGQLYFNIGDYKSARTQFLLVQQNAPTNINIMQNIAKCNIMLNDKDCAMEQIKKILDIFPENEEAKELLKELNKNNE